MLENFTVTSFSDNRPVAAVEEDYSVTRGATCTHIFELPFVCDGYVQELSIIYKQGLRIVLTKDLEDCELTQDQYSSVLTLELSSVDTLKFDENLLDIYVQLKVLTVVDETLYNAPIKLVLVQTLDN